MTRTEETQVTACMRYWLTQGTITATHGLAMARHLRRGGHEALALVVQAAVKAWLADAPPRKDGLTMPTGAMGAPHDKHDKKEKTDGC
jgi:hypothetical protein